jgi:hypothetical protein
MLTPDPVLTWLKVTVFHHFVTVRAAAGERINNYLPAFRHEGLP